MIRLSIRIFRGFHPFSGFRYYSPLSRPLQSGIRYESSRIWKVLYSVTEISIVAATPPMRLRCCCVQYAVACRNDSQRRATGAAEFSIK